MTSRFIVLEGPDGAGTTLHSRLLSEKVAEETGAGVLLTAEPSEGPIGFWIRRQLEKENDLTPETLQMLFSADRSWHVDEVIKPALEANRWVISDRYILSTLAYGEATGVDSAWLKDINDHFLKPDLTLLLLPPLAVAMERLSRRDSRDMFEQSALQEKVHAAYGRLAAGDSSIHVIDSSGEKQATADRIWRLVEAMGL